jgi:sortase A
MAAAEDASPSVGGDVAPPSSVVSDLFQSGRPSVSRTVPPAEAELSSAGAERSRPTDEAEVPGSLKQKSRGDSLLGWFGAVTTAVGVFLALFAAYLFLFTPLQASRAQQKLLSELHGKTGLATLTGHIPPEGKAVAILDIPALHLDTVVVEGTSATDLTAGPGLMPGSALPGTPGNTVIAGRRYLYGKPFSALGSLERGETLQIVSSYGTFTYKVLGTHVVEPGQPDPPTEDNRVTLVTSNASLAPSARVVAEATLVSAPVDVHVSSIGLPPLSERALSGDPGSLVPAILWAIALIAGLGFTVRLYRRWRRTWPIYLMTTPVLLALAVLVFQNLAHLMPATL